MPTGTGYKVGGPAGTQEQKRICTVASLAHELSEGVLACVRVLQLLCCALTTEVASLSREIMAPATTHKGPAIQSREEATHGEGAAAPPQKAGCGTDPHWTTRTRGGCARAATAKFMVLASSASERSQLVACPRAHKRCARASRVSGVERLLSLRGAPSARVRSWNFGLLDARGMRCVLCVPWCTVRPWMWFGSSSAMVSDRYCACAGHSWCVHAALPRRSPLRGSRSTFPSLL